MSANDNGWQTHRAGNWSRGIQFEDSPWFSSHEEDDDPSLAGFYPADGAMVKILHNVTVDANIIIGGSFQAAIWEPLTISTTGGSAVTGLASGTYTLAADVLSARGYTGAGNTISAPFTITQGVSKPRVTFAQAPPAGCTYNLYLAPSTFHPILEAGARRRYCDGIAGATVDLVSGKWNNHWVAGVAQGGTPDIQDAFGSIWPPYTTNAITVSADGRIIVASGKKLLLRGDLVVESPTGSSKQFLQIGSRATFRTDPSQATDPTRADYIMLFQGGGDIHFLG